MVCDPGDVVMANRQALHASFPNTSPDWRVTINFRVPPQIFRYRP